MTAMRILIQGISAEQNQEILNIIATFSEIKTVTLFGSRALGTFKEASDIDLAIEGVGVDAATAIHLKEALEEKTDLPFFFDVIALGSVENEALMEHVRAHGKMIYESGHRNESGWVETTLAEITNIMGGYAFKGNHFGDSGTPVIKIRDINPPFINAKNAMKVEIEKNYPEKNLDRYKMEKGDFVIAMTGATIGKIGILTEPVNAYVNQRVALLKPKPGFSRRFIYYSITSNNFQQFIQNNIDSHSAQENISSTSLGRYPLLIPLLPKERKAIAEVLSSLDDKIDLLHQQNKTLESLAETLFRQWFVEEADEDWEEKSLLDVIELIGGGTPRTSDAQYWDGNIPWLSGGDISKSHKSFVMTSEKNITELGLEKSSAKLLPRLATVISARGTVGKFAILSKPMVYSQSNYGILPKDNNCFFFTYLLISHVVNELQSSAYGSVFDTITTATFKEISIKIPQKTEIESFEKNVADYYRKKLQNLEQIHTLEQLRDTLLPKLMSGEVRVGHEQII